MSRALIHSQPKILQLCRPQRPRDPVALNLGGDGRSQVIAGSSLASCPAVVTVEFPPQSTIRLPILAGVIHPLDTMKKIITLITLTALTVGSNITQAQTVSGQPTFFNSVEAYFTSFDTNSTTFSSERVEIWTALDQAPDVLSADLGVTAVIRPNIVGEVVFQNASVAGTLVSVRGGGGWRFVKFDTELTLGFDGGFRFDQDAFFVDPFIDVRKALTENTYAGIRLDYQQDFRGRQLAAHPPGVKLITGFKF